MQSRDEAVQWLRALGYHAFSRDWGPGQTVGVANRPSESPGGITVYERCVYLYPVDEGRWAVYDHRTREEDQVCDDLRAAAQVAVRRLGEAEPPAKLGR